MALPVGLGGGPVQNPLLRYLESSAGRGRAIDGVVRRDFEPRFGRSLGHLRVIDDAGAARAAGALGARAFTLGDSIWFGGGEYRPASREGRHLIAHEIAHALQSPTSGRQVFADLVVGAADDGSEREADRVADAVVDGRSAAAPLLARPAALRRAIATPIRTHPQPGSRVCLVHLHGNEENALRVAQDIRRDYCASLVYLDNPGSRCITFKYDNPTAGAAIPTSCATTAGPGSAGCTGRFDPNRIFSQNDHVTESQPFEVADCAPAIPPAHRTARGPDTPFGQVTEFRNRLLGEIATCRMGGANPPSPVVAFHNNTNSNPSARHPSLNVHWYDQPPGGHEPERQSTETGAGRRTPLPSLSVPLPSPAANPSLSMVTPDPLHLRDVDNFLVTTDPRDFHGLRGRFNVVLQRTGMAAGSAADDGSLSIRFQNERYINVEAERKPFAGRSNQFFITNRAMADAVMAQLDVPRGPCAPAALVPTSGQPQTLPTQAVQGIGMAQNALPASPVLTSVRRFTRFADLQAVRGMWTARIAAMPQADVLAWIVGRVRPAPAVEAEVTMQRDAMLAELRRARPRLAATGGIQSFYRSFTDQLDIWERKTRFERLPFDRITASAIFACRGLQADSQLRNDEEGTPWGAGRRADRARHRRCWQALTSALRQQQILQASSAPGISRHHWGTDFDLFSVEPSRWRDTARFGRTFEWLAGRHAAGTTAAVPGHAITFGFTQPYSAAVALGPPAPGQRLSGGYMEERWHWSYYPIAQALQDYAVSHQTALETLLRSLWYSRDDFSLIQAQWFTFLTNVQDVATSNLLPP